MKLWIKLQHWFYRMLIDYKTKKIVEFNKEREKYMSRRIQITKYILEEWCEKNMNVHTDWTGTRVETGDTCVSINDFVNKLWDYLEEESDKMD